MNNGSRITRNLPVVLTAEEFESRASELALVEIELVKLDDDKKAAMSEFKAQLEGKVADRRRLSVIVHDRAEYREVECYERLNIGDRVVEIYREDTGEIVGTRGITDKDIQDSLDFMADRKRDDEKQ